MGTIACSCFQNSNINNLNRDKQGNLIVDLMRSTSKKKIKSKNKIENSLNNLDTSPDTSIYLNNIKDKKNSEFDSTINKNNNYNNQNNKKKNSINSNFDLLRFQKDEILKKMKFSLNGNNINEKNVLILGPEESGKTSLMMRYLEYKFDDFYIPSLNDEINTKLIFGKKKFILSLYISNNISTYENYNFDCNFVLYDITSQESFSKAKEIIDYLKLNNSNNKIFLIGNKIDLDSNFDEEKEKEKLNKIFANKNIEIFFISVKRNFGISAMMIRFQDMFKKETVIDDNE
jgi:GTPase SAR1 family protein